MEKENQKEGEAHPGDVAREGESASVCVHKAEEGEEDA
jgi:hypothetical protein